MQLIDTHVGNAYDGTITVEFQGEGGELVSVKMVAGDGLEGDAAINRAKAMMVQLTAFAEGRDLSKDECERTQDETTDTKEPGSELSEAKAGLPVISAFGQAPFPAA